MLLLLLLLFIGLRINRLDALEMNLWEIYLRTWFSNKSDTREKDVHIVFFTQFFDTFFFSSFLSILDTLPQCYFASANNITDHWLTLWIPWSASLTLLSTWAITLHDGNLDAFRKTVTQHIHTLCCIEWMHPWILRHCTWIYLSWSSHFILFTCIDVERQTQQPIEEKKKKHSV